MYSSPPDSSPRSKSGRRIAALVAATVLTATGIAATAAPAGAATGGPSARAGSAPVAPHGTTAPLAIGQVISVDGTGTVTTRKFSTTGPRLLVVFTSAASPAYMPPTNVVSGAGLSWRQWWQADTQNGASEVWSAMATGPLTGVTVTATPQSTTYDQSLTVMVFKGAGGVGIGGAASAINGAPSVTVATTVPGSWIFGVGEDYTAASRPIPGSGQDIFHKWIDPADNQTFWVQGEAAPAPVVGTKVVFNDTKPTSDGWSLAAIEVLPAG